MVFVARSYVGVLQIGEPDDPAALSASLIVYACQTRFPVAGSRSTSDPRKLGAYPSPRNGAINSSTEDTPIATLWPTIVGDPQIAANGCGFGRMVHFTAPVSTSSPWIWPDRSPITTVRLVTRALALTFTKPNVGPTFSGVSQSLLPSR